jgi:hypothetical protein
MEPDEGKSAGLQVVRVRSRIAAREHRMDYRKINVEIVVFADEADAVVAELNSAIDRLEDKYTIFGGDIEAVPVEKSGTRRKSALTHTLAAGDSAVAALKLAGDKIVGAYRKII